MIHQAKSNPQLLDEQIFSERLSSAISAIDVVDGVRSRHRSAIGWFVGDESHEGSRPHANNHDRFGYRQDELDLP
jgi:hypothetical protein